MMRRRSISGGRWTVTISQSKAASSWSSGIDPLHGFENRLPAERIGQPGPAFDEVDGPAEQLLKLLLEGEVLEKAEPYSRFVFNKQIDITGLAEVGAEGRSKHEEFSNAVSAADRCKLIEVDIEAVGHVPSSYRRQGESYEHSRPVLRSRSPASCGRMKHQRASS